MGSVKCPGCQAHHLVPGSMGTAARAREILAKCHIDINSPVNGIWLRGRNSPSGWAGALHNGRHPGDYGTIVSDRLEAAYVRGGKQEVEMELQKILNDLFDETSDLYNLI